MRDSETYWKWHKHYVPPKWRGAAEHKRQQLEAQAERDAAALAEYASRKADRPVGMVINRRKAA